MAQEVLFNCNASALPERSRRRRQRARRTLIGFAVFLAFVLLFLWYIGVFGGNIRPVVAGKVYRSAQITGKLLDEVLDSQHIRTVINLRGGSPSDWWYKEEASACAQRGINHVDIGLSAIRLPPPQRLQQLLATFDHAAYPILFHCQGGADRSGLVGTLYLNLYQNVPLDEAEARQLTWRYGHLKFTRTGAMDEFFAMYRADKSGLGLREWIEKRYPALYAAAPAYLKMDVLDLKPLALALPKPH